VALASQKVSQYCASHPSIVTVTTSGAAEYVATGLGLGAGVVIFEEGEG
jgi:hypothetical protein